MGQPPSTGGRSCRAGGLPAAGGARHSLIDDRLPGPQAKTARKAKSFPREARGSDNARNDSNPEYSRGFCSQGGSGLPGLARTGSRFDCDSGGGPARARRKAHLHGLATKLHEQPGRGMADADMDRVVHAAPSVKMALVRRGASAADDWRTLCVRTAGG